MTKHKSGQLLPIGRGTRVWISDRLQIQTGITLLYRMGEGESCGSYYIVGVAIILTRVFWLAEWDVTLVYPTLANNKVGVWIS